jgi:CRP/FNR family transcriptional regulator, cyclic AMP receptor protein
MAGKSGSVSFDPQNFLAKVGVGKTISKFHKDQVIFSQGEAADAVFYIQKGRVKVVVISDQGRKRSSGSWKPASSLAKDVSTVIICASQQRPPWRNV